MDWYIGTRRKQITETSFPDGLPFLKLQVKVGDGS